MAGNGRMVAVLQLICLISAFVSDVRTKIVRTSSPLQTFELDFSPARHFERTKSEAGISSLNDAHEE